MKKKLLIGLIAFCFIGLVFIVMAFKSAPEEHKYLYVRIVETENAGMSQILVSDGTAIIKTIWLEKKKYWPVKVSDNFSKIVAALEEIRNQGYKLISSNGGGGYEYDATTYIFEKE